MLALAFLQLAFASYHNTPCCETYGKSTERIKREVSESEIARLSSMYVKVREFQDTTADPDVNSRDAARKLLEFAGEYLAKRDPALVYRLESATVESADVKECSMTLGAHIKQDLAPA
jgi:hypothetical protein